MAKQEERRVFGGNWGLSMVIDGRRRDDGMKIGRSLGLSMVISEGLRSRFMNGVREPVKRALEEF